MLLCVSGCGNKSVSNNESSSVDAEAENNNATIKNNPSTETVAPIQKESADSDEKPQNNQIAKTNLKPSEGFKFESNGGWNMHDHRNWHLHR